MSGLDTRQRRRALEASGLLRFRWPAVASGSRDDVDETAEGLWRAREEASWEALQLRLSTAFGALETEHVRQSRRLGARQNKRRSRLQAALDGERSWLPVKLRRLWWWLRLCRSGGGDWRTLRSALAASGPTAGEWMRALERQLLWQSERLRQRQERRLARTAHAAARAYRVDLDGQVAVCRRDALALLPGPIDREAGVRACPPDSDTGLGPPDGTP